MIGLFLFFFFFPTSAPSHSISPFTSISQGTLESPCVEENPMWSGTPYLFLPFIHGNEEFNALASAALRLLVVTYSAMIGWMDHSSAGCNLDSITGAGVVGLGG